MLTKINKRIKKQKGFTLVELLLVVAILAVLALLAVPAIAGTIRNARVRTCAANERMVEEAVMRWYADQVAAGKTIVTEDEEDLTIAGFHETLLGDEAADEDDLTLYFKTGTPTCPFTDGDTYLISVTFEFGSLTTIEVVCSASEDGDSEDGHPRALDRKAPTGEGSE